MNIVESGIELFVIPPGMTLTAVPMVAGAVITITSVKGASFAPIRQTTKATVGGFTEQCTAAVAADGGAVGVVIQDSAQGDGNFQRLNGLKIPTVGVVGDSIARNQYTGSVRGGLVGTVRRPTPFGAWGAWGCGFSGVAWPELYAMEGYSGQRAEEIFASLQAANATETWGAASTIPVGTRARLPSIVVDVSGTNDLFQSTPTTASDGTALARAIAGRRAIWAYLRACGVVPIAMSMLPMQGTVAGAGGQNGNTLAPLVPAWNTAMQAAAAADGVAWVDGYTPCAVASGGGWRPGFTYRTTGSNPNVDDPTGLHPSTLASIAIGQALAAVLRAVVASAPGLPRLYLGGSSIYSAAFAANDPRTFFANFDNGMFSGTTGWSSRFDQNADSTFGLVTPTQDRNGGGTLRFRKPTNSGSRYADWQGPALTVAAGQEYVLAVDYRAALADHLSLGQIGVIDDTSGSASRYQLMAEWAAGGDIPPGTTLDTGVSRVLLYYRVPAGVTQVRPFVIVNRSAGGTAGAFDEVYISNLLQIRLA